MKIGAGIAGISLGIIALLYVGLFGGMVGSAAGWLGSLGPGNSTVTNWATVVSLISWLAPLLAIVGGIVTFSNPRAGGVLLAASACLLWYLLGLGMIGKIFVLPIAAAAVLAFLAEHSTSGESVSAPTGATPATSGPSERAASPTTASFERAKWNALLQYDTDIAAVADRVRPLGQRWLDELASSYLALNAKTYLPEIERKIMAAAKEEEEEAERQKVLAEEQRRALAQEQERLAQADRQQREHAAQERRNEVERWRNSLWSSWQRRLIVIACGVVAVLLGAAALRSIRHSETAATSDGQIAMPLESGATQTLRVGEDGPKATAARTPRLTKRIFLTGPPRDCTTVTCLRDKMRDSGASPKEIQLLERIAAERGFVAGATGLRNFGQVDLVSYDGPRENAQFVLVDRDLETVWLDRVDLQAAVGNFKEFVTQHPRALVPLRPDFVGQRGPGGGQQRFMFQYPVADCMACEPYGALEVEYDFDKDGHFVTSKVADLRAWSARLASVPIYLKSSELDVPPPPLPGTSTPPALQSGTTGVPPANSLASHTIGSETQGTSTSSVGQSSAQENSAAKSEGLVNPLARTAGGDTSTNAASVGEEAGRFAGTWSGMVKQPRHAAFDISMTLGPAQAGQVAGSVQYSERGCAGSGSLILESVSDNRASFTQRMSSGRCVTETRFDMVLQDSQTAVLTWKDSFAGTKGTVGRE